MERGPAVRPAVRPGVDAEGAGVALPAKRRSDPFHDLQEALPVAVGQIGVHRQRIDPGELPLAVDLLAVDADDAQLGRGEEGGAAVVRDAVQPGLEEERPVLLEQALDRPPRFLVFEARVRERSVLGDVAVTARGREGGLDHPARRGGTGGEDAVELRRRLHHPGSRQRATQRLGDAQVEGAVVDGGDDRRRRGRQVPDQLAKRRVPGDLAGPWRGAQADRVRRLAPGEDLGRGGDRRERAGRRRPQAVAVAGEDAELGGEARGGLPDGLARLPAARASGVAEAGEVVLGEQVAEDQPRPGRHVGHQGRLSSSRRMNSASSPAASRPARWKRVPRARAGRSGQVRWRR